MTRADVEGAQAPLARLLPALRFDADDPAASRILGFIGHRRSAPPHCRIAASSSIASPKSAEAKLRLADAMIAAGQPDAAIVLTDRILGDNEFEWRAHWYAGKALLTMANKAASHDIAARAVKGAGDPVALAKQAQGRFDRVYFEMPGELAPRLGIAMAAEVAKDFKTASLYYGRVEAIDPALASAVFGLARCRLELDDATRRGQCARRDAAIAFDVSRIASGARLRLYRGRPGQESGFLVQGERHARGAENRERGAASGRGRAHRSGRSSSSNRAKSKPTPPSASSAFR